MIDSRTLDALLPTVRLRVDRFLSDAAAAGIQLLVTSTYRDFECQKALHAQGRTKPGPRCLCGGRSNPVGSCPRHPLGATVTQASAGASWHNWRRAVDVVPIRYGKPIWDARGNGLDDDPTDDATDTLELWQRVGQIGKRAGLEWAGDWKRGREFPHFQFREGLEWAELLRRHPEGLG